MSCATLLMGLHAWDLYEVDALSVPLNFVL